MHHRSISISRSLTVSCLTYVHTKYPLIRLHIHTNSGMDDHEENGIRFSADPSSGHSAAPASCPSTLTTYRTNHARNHWNQPVVVSGDESDFLCRTEKASTGVPPAELILSYSIHLSSHILVHIDSSDDWLSRQRWISRQHSLLKQENHLQTDQVNL